MKYRPSIRLVKLPVKMLLHIIVSIFEGSMCPLTIKFSISATNDAKNPTTIDCNLIKVIINTYFSSKYKKITKNSLLESNKYFPKLNLLCF